MAPRAGDEVGEANDVEDGETADRAGGEGGDGDNESNEVDDGETSHCEGGVGGDGDADAKTNHPNVAQHQQTLF